MAISPSHPLMNTLTREPWYRRTRVLVMFALIAGGAGWVSGLFQWPFVSHLMHPAPAAITVKPTAQVAAPTYVIPPPPLGNDSSLSPVPLPLILTGTMPGRNAHEGTAFIGVNQDSPQTYAAGALLVNNARIAEIYTDHVVLEKDGKRVNLYLLGSGKSSDAKQLASLLTVGGTSPPPPAKITSHEMLTDYIRPSPVYDGQTLKGYQVYPGQNASVFLQMGLQPGDVITAINGSPLNEPHSAIEQFQQLTEGAAVTATVEHKDKKTESLSLDGSLITQDQQRQQNPPTSPMMNLPPM
jgi:general secretion pathway protein C